VTLDGGRQTHAEWLTEVTWDLTCLSCTDGTGFGFPVLLETCTLSGREVGGVCDLYSVGFPSSK
jgi:hypothetical protein